MKWMILGLFLVFLCAPAIARAENVQATYALYTGGVRMIDVEASFDLEPKAYNVSAAARTIGLFAKLLPWTGDFKTTGIQGYIPTRHDYDVGWRGHSEKRSFVYEPAGVLKSMTLTEDGKTRDDPVDADLAKDTRDMLSTLMTMLKKYRETGSCTTDVLTFDGKRSFIVRFKDVNKGVLNNPELSSYTGNAHGCSVEVIPQKGKWPKKPRGWLRIQKQAEGRLPIIWLAQPKPTLPYMPVRIDIHTKFGDVIAHLSALN